MQRQADRPGRVSHIPRSIAVSVIALTEPRNRGKPYLALLQLHLSVIDRSHKVGLPICIGAEEVARRRDYGHRHIAATDDAHPISIIIARFGARRLSDSTLPIASAPPHTVDVIASHRIIITSYIAA